jgi:hypothetical protein
MKNLQTVESCRKILARYNLDENVISAYMNCAQGVCFNYCALKFHREVVS